HVVDDPGLDPAIETARDEFIRVVGITRSQGLEMMKGMQIANCPGNQRRKRKRCDQDPSHESIAKRIDLSLSSRFQFRIEQRPSRFWFRIRQQPSRFWFRIKQQPSCFWLRIRASL